MPTCSRRLRILGESAAAGCTCPARDELIPRRSTPLHAHVKPHTRGLILEAVFFAYEPSHTVMHIFAS
jgi:hypothetical protein